MLTRLRTILQHLNFARADMSTTVHNTNEACCSIPPVQSDYEPKGTYKAYGGFKRVRSHLAVRGIYAEVVIAGVRHWPHHANQALSGRSL